MSLKRIQQKRKTEILTIADTEQNNTTILRESMKKFSGLKLKKILEEKDVSQATIAERLDLSPATISAWINGKCEPEAKNIERVAQLLSITEESLYEELPELSLRQGDHNHNIGVNVYNSTVNISGDMRTDIAFLDDYSPEKKVVSFYLHQNEINTIIETAKISNSGIGKYLSQIIHQHFNPTK